MRKRNNALLLFLIALVACQTNTAPKPHGFLRIDLPQRSYVPFRSDCPFTFKASCHSHTLSRQAPADSFCWTSLHYTALNATLYLTYQPVNNNIGTLVNDAWENTYQHNKIADGIETVLFAGNANSGVLFKLHGEAASSTQFFVTDSTNHFLSGALYFDDVAANDSVAPITRYLREELIMLIETTEWRNEPLLPPVEEEFKIEGCLD